MATLLSPIQLGGVAGDRWRASKIAKVYADGEYSFVPGRFDEIKLHGRVYCFANDRWVGPNNTSGTSEPNWNNDMGTGAEPNVEWNLTGHIIEPGTIIRRVACQYHGNNNAISALRMRLFAQSGDFSGTWDSVGETTRTTILAEDAMPASGADHQQYFAEPMATVSAAGYLIPVFQPTITGTTTRYLSMQIKIEVELP